MKGFLIRILSILLLWVGGTGCEPSIEDMRANRDIDGLIERLQDSDPSIRQKATVTLGELGDARAVPSLISLLRDVDTHSNREAMNALLKIGRPAVGPLIMVLEDSNNFIRSKAIAVLGRIGKPAVGPLLTALGSNVSYHASEVLSEIGEPAVEPLLTILDSNVGYHAAEALGKIGQPAVSPLIVALGHKNNDVRENAARALGNIGDARAVAPLILALDDKAMGVREYAAQALGKLGDTRAVAPLITALGDVESTIRSKAVEALGKLGDARAVLHLIPILDDSNSVTRSLAVETLEDMMDTSAIKPLVEYFTNLRSRSRHDAARLLYTLGWKPESDRGKVYFGFYYPGYSNWPLIKRVLLDDLESSDSYTVRNAIYRFMQIGNDEIIPDLKKKLMEDGTIQLAETYLNSGNTELAEIAYTWVSEQGYVTGILKDQPEESQVLWGSSNKVKS